MEWTTERRYRRYEDWTQEERKEIQEKMAQSPWHVSYHIEPKEGLLNDPNGFSYFDGKWVVFYQNFPFGAAHGLKSWVQLESDDLVHFTEQVLKSCLILHWIATALTQDLLCSLVINCSFSIQEMSVMKIGFATLSDWCLDG